MFVLDKAHHVPESSTEIVRTKMFGKPLEMTRRGWYKTAVSTNRLPSGYTLRVNMTSDTFLEEADEWRTEMWHIIRQRPDGRLVLTTVFFYILTKRVPRIMECLPEDWDTKPTAQASPASLASPSTSSITLWTAICWRRAN